MPIGPRKSVCSAAEWRPAAAKRAINQVLGLNGVPDVSVLMRSLAGGTTSLPTMLKHGYEPPMAAGVVAISGTLALEVRSQPVAEGV